MINTYVFNQTNINMKIIYNTIIAALAKVTRTDRHMQQEHEELKF